VRLVIHTCLDKPKLTNQFFLKLISKDHHGYSYHWRRLDRSTRDKSIHITHPSPVIQPSPLVARQQLARRRRRHHITFPSLDRYHSHFSVETPTQLFTLASYDSATLIHIN
jgi:hypothetical protein